MALSRCPSAASGAPPALTVGVEEEFFLLDRDGLTTSLAPAVLDLLSSPERFQHEWMQCQIESATPVCADLPSLATELVAGRRAVAEAAAATGAVVVASGTPPCRAGGPMVMTDDERYRRLRARLPGSEDLVTCGCHVHVGVPSRDVGVAVVNLVSGWLPVLLALGGNSPMWGASDSGWESYRHAVSRRWPTARVAPWCVDTAEYDAAVAAEIAEARAIDPASVYWHLRLSPHLPTVEFRVADVGLTVSDSLLQAALSRALVATALTAIAATGVAPSAEALTRGGLLDESMTRAARYGVRALLLDPSTEALGPAQWVLRQMIRHLRPALLAAGDWATVTDLLAQRRRRGSGAQRQRDLRSASSDRHYVAALAAASLPSDAPPQPPLGTGEVSHDSGDTPRRRW